MSFADFNGDGLDDLTFGHHGGALSFYAGNGDGFDSIDLGLELPTAEARAFCGPILTAMATKIYLSLAGLHPISSG